MADTLPKPPYVSPGQVLVDLPYDNWAILRRSLPRAVAMGLRQKLWQAGIVGAMPIAQFSYEQRLAYEEDWAERVALYVRSWSVRGADDPDGAVLSVNRDGVDLMDDAVYQALVGEIGKLMTPPTPAQVVDKSAARVGVGEGADEVPFGTPGTSAGDLPEGAVVGHPGSEVA